MLDNCVFDHRVMYFKETNLNESAFLGFIMNHHIFDGFSLFVAKIKRTMDKIRCLFCDYICIIYRNDFVFVFIVWVVRFTLQKNRIMCSGFDAVTLYDACCIILCIHTQSN